MRATARVAPTVSDIVGTYKSLVTNGCLNICKSNNEIMGKLWQRNYYQHIMRINPCPEICVEQNGGVERKTKKPHCNE